MAIRLKNILYSFPIKFLSVLMIFTATSIFLFATYKLAIKDDFAIRESYYQTYTFKNDYQVLANDIIQKELNFSDEAAIKASSLTDNEKSVQIQVLRRINKNIEDSKSFIYVLINEDTGELRTNVKESNPVEFIQKLPSVVLWDYSGIYYPGESKMDQYAYDEVLYYWNESHNIYNQLIGTSWQYYTAVTDPLIEGDVFFGEDATAFYDFKAVEPYYLGCIILAIVIGLLSLIHLTITTGKKNAGDEPKTIWYDHIPMEIQLILTFLSILPMFYFGESFNERDSSAFLYMLILLALFFEGILLIQYQSIVRLLKTKKFIENTLMYKLIISLRNLFRFTLLRGAFRPWIVFLLLAYLVINMIFVILIISRSVVALFLFIAFNGFTVYQLLKHLKDVKVIMDAVHERAKGQLDYPLDIDVLTPTFIGLGTDLNALQGGLKVALNEAIRGEKMKTELITNVTHDLKNPLTSIISYIDLLKKEELQNEQAQSYIAILDEKSNRLKILIEQLVEASKASSGNLPVLTETIDVYQLMQQVQGEFDEALKDAKLTVVMDEVEEPLWVKGDNKHLWRIIENLMSNVVKYAMSGTRVYVSFEETIADITIFIKNISANPLNIPVEELTQRFVRGDLSRNTEGSGLGLSIALSLAKLMEADLNIKIDGDLFKVGIKLPRE